MRNCFENRRNHNLEIITPENERNNEQIIFLKWSKNQNQNVLARVTVGRATIQLLLSIVQSHIPLLHLSVAEISTNSLCVCV